MSLQVPNDLVGVMPRPRRYLRETLSRVRVEDLGLNRLSSRVTPQIFGWLPGDEVSSTGGCLDLTLLGAEEYLKRANPLGYNRRTSYLLPPLRRKSNLESPRRY